MVKQCLPTLPQLIQHTDMDVSLFFILVYHIKCGFLWVGGGLTLEFLKTIKPKFDLSPLLITAYRNSLFFFFQVVNVYFK